MRGTSVSLGASRNRSRLIFSRHRNQVVLKVKDMVWTLVVAQEHHGRKGESYFTRRRFDGYGQGRLKRRLAGPSYS